MALVDERPKAASLLLHLLVDFSRPAVIQEAAGCQEQQNNDECPHKCALINDNKSDKAQLYSHYKIVDVNKQTPFRLPKSSLLQLPLNHFKIINLPS